MTHIRGYLSHNEFFKSQKRIDINKYPSYNTNLSIITVKFVGGGALLHFMYRQGMLIVARRPRLNILTTGIEFYRKYSLNEGIFSLAS